MSDLEKNPDNKSGNNDVLPEEIKPEIIKNIDSSKESHVLKKSSSSKESTEQDADIDPQYIKKLREENKKRRIREEELEKTLEERNNAADKALSEVKTLRNAFEKRLINAELQAVAAKEGLIDFDAFKMADLSEVKLLDNGDISGLDKVMEDLKTNKPYLFKISSNSNSKGASPVPVDDKDNRPTYATKEDFKKSTDSYLASLR